jgi:2-keto-4-pentenoate hydratase/2-oxohepta-3-ene-1,7-dioic acid hydratase in catechol pathway
MLLRHARRDEDAMTWLPPVGNAAGLYGIGGNSPLYFRDKEYQIPAYPRGFMRPTNAHSLIGHRGTVTIPSQYSNMRTSAELGVVIGKTGKNVKPEEAMDYVYGYTLVNDMCSDSWKVVALAGVEESMVLKDITIFTQRNATSYYSRSTDSFAAVGAWIVTKDEIPDPYNLMIWNRMSGVQRERTHTQAMVNSVERTVSFFSRLFTLRPGMIFHMGTMGIDGYTVEPDMKLTKDDYYEIEYERVGALRCYVDDRRA